MSPVKDQPGICVLHLVLENGPEPNTLLAVRSAEAASISIVGASGPLAIPARARPNLSGLGVHMMVMGLEGELEEGREVPITLRFDPAGDITARARIGVPADPHALHRMGARTEVALIEEGVPMPEVSLKVRPHQDGWEVQIDAAHFTFVPERDAPVHKPGHGHAHLYLNGMKLQRVYEKRAYIGALPAGRHELRVTLNTTTHMAYRNSDGPIEARANITVE